MRSPSAPRSPNGLTRGVCRSRPRRRAFRLSDARYKGGVDSFLGLLDAQRSRYLAEQELIVVRLADAANRVALYKVLGGGWQ